jgi:quercetin dioxygenase-like cupin family protein
MRTRPRFLAGIAITCAMTVAWSARVHQDVAAQTPKPIQVTRIYTGSDGRTHAEETQLALKRSASGGEQSETMAVDSLRFARTPPNQVSDWHNASRRQYVFTISGRGEVELEGGKKIPLDPEHVLLAEDLTGKGHITRTFGNGDRISVIVTLAK